MTLTTVSMLEALHGMTITMSIDITTHITTALTTTITTTVTPTTVTETKTKAREILPMFHFTSFSDFGFAFALDVLASITGPKKRKEMQKLESQRPMKNQTKLFTTLTISLQAFKTHISIL